MFLHGRNERDNRGSAVAEVFNRKIRKYLESILREKYRIMPFKDILREVETALNNDKMSVMQNLSPVEALAHNPNYINQVSLSAKISRRKFYKQERFRPNLLPLYGIVRVIISLKRKKSLGIKESYGWLSRKMYIITKVVYHQDTVSYKLGDLFSRVEIPNISYKRYELHRVNLNWMDAVYKEERVIGQILARDQQTVTYRVRNYDHIAIAPVAIVSR